MSRDAGCEKRTHRSRPPADDDSTQGSEAPSERDHPRSRRRHPRRRLAVARHPFTPDSRGIIPGHVHITGPAVLVLAVIVLVVAGILYIIMNGGGP